MLDELAWLLATYPDSKSRDGTEAVRLAERACELTDRRFLLFSIHWLRLTLRPEIFRGRSLSAEEALNRARASGDTDAVKLSESILASLRADVPYRQEPE